MARSKVPITVELDGGRQLQAVVDQRDFARAEGQDISAAAKYTWIRFLGYAALTRTGQYEGTWERFNGVDCVEVAEVPAAAEDDADDPGRPDRGAGS